MRLAERQFGLVARHQLVFLDVAASQIRSWLRCGYLIPRLPGVYAVGLVVASVQGDLTAPVLYAGPGAMLTGAIGCWWLGLRDHRPAVIEVATPRHRASLPGIRVLDRRDEPRIWHRGLPVAPIGELLLRYAVTATAAELRRALAQVEYHGYVDLDLLLPLLGRKPGSRALRNALRAHDPRLARVRSPLEIDFLDLCATHGIPAPEVNTVVEGVEVDMLWREQRVIVELDGVANHRTAAQLRRDHERDLKLRSARYVVLRYGSAQVAGAPAEVAADVLAALSRAGPSGG